MASYKFFFATTQHGRKCIKATCPSTPPTREEVLLIARKLIDEDKTPPAKGKFRRFLHMECRVKSEVGANALR